jgi:hypothetical protein
MYDMSEFFDYLKETDKPLPTSKRGLIDNAPQKAIDAYERYKSYEKERLKNDEEWE